MFCLQRSDIDFMKINKPFPERILSLYSRGIYTITSHQEKLANLQSSFLTGRSELLQRMGDYILTSTDAFLDHSGQQRAKFSRRMLEEFASGSIEKCFGDDYKVLRGARYPRIPNSSLLCISRIVDISGTRYEISPGSEIIAEFDILGNEWFLNPNGDGIIPISVLMEIALQPCGFLSAYLGTILTIPGKDIYFRNLDGQATLECVINSIGKTLKTKAVLLSSASSGETVIQRYSFMVSCGDLVIFHGQSVFGYFSKESLFGLSGSGAMVDRKLDFYHHPDMTWEIVPVESIRPDLTHIIPSGRARMVDEVKYLMKAQKIEKIHAFRRIFPSDWYFRCHFYEDPVMPGSLGIEAIYQALIGTLHHAFLSDFPNLVILPEVGKVFSWKYRGQILPETDTLRLEITDIKIDTSHREFWCVDVNAFVWSADVRVYEVKGLTVQLFLNRGS